ncbi:U32 family peptidase, partial [Enterococcus faecalis]|uniref:U32 family peptidase n=1 Tax=Enterococcus faecalis TaxID=1351 RepID=UPI003CC60175
YCYGSLIFANNDVKLMYELSILYDHHYRTWKLDGLYTPAENLVAIARLYHEAKAELEAGTRTEDHAAHATAEIEKLHATRRGLDNGLFDLSGDA